MIYAVNVATPDILSKPVKPFCQVEGIAWWTGASVAADSVGTLMRTTAFLMQTFMDICKHHSNISGKIVSVVNIDSLHSVKRKQNNKTLQ